MRLVIFGPQGAGKGTQAARISEKYGVPAISTGEIFRWAIKGKTALGNKVTEYVEAGKLVPDELTIEVVRERLEADDCADGFLIDGFPRNIEQAKALDAILAENGTKLDAALVLNVSGKVALRRILGRRICSECGTNYHIDSPPENDWTCDVCGGKVVKRTDDHDDEIVRERLSTYYAQTEPLKSYYADKGILVEVDGTGSPDEVFSRIVEALG